MTNPFTSGTGGNVYDRPAVLGKDGQPVAPASGGQTEHSVLFDPAAKTASPAGVAFLGHIFAEVKRLVKADRKDQSSQIMRGLTTTLAEEVLRPVAEMQAKIARLEEALDVKTKATEAEIRDALSSFLGEAPEDGPEPSLEELNRMAEAHHKSMAARTGESE